MQLSIAHPRIVVGVVKEPSTRPRGGDALHRSLDLLLLKVIDPLLLLLKGLSQLSFRSHKVVIGVKDSHIASKVVEIDR